MTTTNILSYELQQIIKKWAAEKAAELSQEQVEATVQNAISDLAAEFGITGGKKEPDRSGVKDWVQVAVDEHQGIDVYAFPELAFLNR